MRSIKTVVIACTALLAAVAPWRGGAEHFQATPSDYAAKLLRLAAGDTLMLEPGIYRAGLRLHQLQGTPDKPIVITGPAGSSATFLAASGRNTISILNAAHLVVKNLVLDGQGLPVDGVKCEGHAEWAHHITLENLIIRGHGNNQQTVGISTKCPAWNWVIRHNVIEGAGTGMYLGNSDGRAPFIAGLIEHNLIVDTLGYNLQIKHQQPRPALPGMPNEKSATIIRHNVFSKAQGGSKEMARPNVLVGHWPLAGPGADDQYFIYGNFFYQNPHEALFQGEGNIALYNNLFVNHAGDAVRIQPHNDTPRDVAVFRNTVMAKGAGITLARREGDPPYPQLVSANSLFANPPLHGAAMEMNLTGSFDQAGDYLVRPFAPLGEMDLRPKAGKGSKKAKAKTHFEIYPEADRDFDVSLRGADVVGAYAPEKKGLRWLPVLEIKPPAGER
ncbi:MAG: hypothetical protein HZA59_09495 [Hydrogenophilales bacterium]|nr:hypothetical protein [Hydrogenophilales bacterium]